ncbi:hypothetical protein [Megamonas funiformis]|uniref:hypothetical protein n=1 Tax=Megamonas funiformis TaxID=437897 RepID=UPI00241E8A1A|nr:hypothetical protein [Megamonas funiformis]
MIDTGIRRILAPPPISDGEVIGDVPNENGIGGEAVEGNGEMRIVLATPSGSVFSFITVTKVILLEKKWSLRKNYLDLYAAAKNTAALQIQKFYLLSLLKKIALGAPSSPSAFSW